MHQPEDTPEPKQLPMSRLYEVAHDIFMKGHGTFLEPVIETIVSKERVYQNDRFQNRIYQRRRYRCKLCKREAIKDHLENEKHKQKVLDHMPAHREHALRTAADVYDISQLRLLTRPPGKWLAIPKQEELADLCVQIENDVNIFLAGIHDGNEAVD